MRDDIADLNERGLRDLVHQLVDFHPPSRERIADILPTIKRSQPPAIVKSTESKYFEKQVDTCRYYDSSEDSTSYRIMSRHESCEIVSRATTVEIEDILFKVVYFDRVGSEEMDCSKEQHSVDAAIAILDIGLLLLERTKRLARPDHQRIACSCVCCLDEPDDPGDWCCNELVSCNVTAHFMILSDIFRLVRPFMTGLEMYGEGNESEDDCGRRGNQTNPE